ncbi:MAG: hypothetical protein HY821_14235 [Acidobacteria bacterium]|nr:hypothetical protein [Acidobacteriota bacterium]
MTRLQAIVRTAAGWGRWLLSSPVRASLLVFTIAALVRLAILFGTGSQGSDCKEACRVAMAIVQDGEFASPYAAPTGPTAHLPPFFPFLLSLLFGWLGAGLAGQTARCVINVLAYSTLYGLMPWVADQLGLGRRAGFWAGLILAAYPVHISAEVHWGWDEAVAGMALAGMVVWTRRLWMRGWAPGWAAVTYGAAWGALYHSAPSLLPSCVLLAVLAVAMAPRRGQAVRWWLAAGCAAVLVVMPWTLRNHAQFGEWIFIRNNLGIELSQGFNDRAGFTMAENKLSGAVMTHPTNDPEEAMRLKAMGGEIVYNRMLLHQTFDWIREHPRRAAWLMVGHGLAFWFGIGTGYRVVVAILTISSVLAWAAMILRLRRSQPVTSMVLLPFWVAYPAVYLFFQYVGRYRVAVDWSFFLVAAWGVLSFTGLGGDDGAERG